MNDPISEAQPVIELSNLVAKARDPNGKIVGIDAEKVATEVTEAGAFTLKDVKISGTLLEPRIDMGDTLKQIAIEGGKRFVAKAATAAVDKAADAASKKVEEKLGNGKAGEAAKGLLDKGKGLFGNDGK